MATESVNPPNKNTPIQSPLSMRELATLLVKHFGLHEGRYDLTVEFKIGFGGVGPDLESLIPGAIIGLNKVGLTTTELMERDPRRSSDCAFTHLSATNVGTFTSQSD